jgi:hypothetical protein
VTGTEGGGGLGITGVAEERGGEAWSRPARRRSETRTGDGDERCGSPGKLGSLVAWWFDLFSRAVAGPGTPLIYTGPLVLVPAAHRD